MKLDDSLPAGAASGTPSADSSTPTALVRSFLALGVALCAVIGGVYWSSWVQLVSVWERSVTYNHCFLVFPVSAWLMYRERAVLAGLRYRPFWAGLPVLALLGALWLVAVVAGLNSLRDLAIVATVPALMVTVLGSDFARAMRFPLAFMVFAWPFGEVLIPPFIDLTADFTVAALRFTGVPVFREGNSLIIPTGHWSVVQECSGIRYLMASAFAGTVFAHLNMRSRRRWIAFVAIAIVVPIVANWLRAYLTVMLGHLTSNRLAVGVDHLIYGWVFFGIVMTGVFLIGARMADVPVRAASPAPSTPRGPRPGSVGVGRLAVVVVLTLAAVALGPLWKTTLKDTPVPGPSSAAAQLPAPSGAWTAASRDGRWVPPESAIAQSTASATYGVVGGPVTIWVSQSTESDPERKLLAFSLTTLADYDGDTKVLNRRTANVALGRGTLQVVEKQIRHQGEHLLVWYWYRVGSTLTDSAWRTRITRLMNVLAGHSALIEVWTLSVPVGDEVGPAREAMSRFMREQEGRLVRGDEDRRS